MKPFDFHIVIVTFNRASLVLKSLESILKQEKVSIYVDIVNNGSTDNTAELLQKAVSNYSTVKNCIAIHNLRRNIDPCDAVKQSISAFKGSYFNILGDDDSYISENLLYYIRELFCSSCNVNSIIGGYDTIPFDELFNPLNSKLVFYQKILNQSTYFGITDTEICAIQALQWNLKANYHFNLGCNINKSSI